MEPLGARIWRETARMHRREIAGTQGGASSFRC